MRLEGLLAGVTDWSSIPQTTQSGASGTTSARARRFGDIQLRLVSYSPGYVADHWCHKGHIVFVVDGRLAIEHEDGRRYELRPGMSYHVADKDGAPHRVVTEHGASLFIVD